jgi:hypothetical protein
VTYREADLLIDDACSISLLTSCTSVPLPPRPFPPLSPLAGLVTYREADLLIDDASSASRQLQRVAEVVIHELAHQWFGNLVTMEWCVLHRACKTTYLISMGGGVTKRSI